MTRTKQEIRDHTCLFRGSTEIINRVFHVPPPASIVHPNRLAESFRESNTRRQLRASKESAA